MVPLPSFVVAIAPSSGKDVLAFIIEDLKYAKANIEKFDVANASLVQLTPTSEAASALLARVYRMNGDIQSAGKEAEELINSGKFSISDNPKVNSSEVILKFAGNCRHDKSDAGRIRYPEEYEHKGAQRKPIIGSRIILTIQRD